MFAKKLTLLTRKQKPLKNSTNRKVFYCFLSLFLKCVSNYFYISSMKLYQPRVCYFRKIKPYLSLSLALSNRYMHFISRWYHNGVLALIRRDTQEGLLRFIRLAFKGEARICSRLGTNYTFPTWWKSSCIIWYPKTIPISKSVASPFIFGSSNQFYRLFLSFL